MRHSAWLLKKPCFALYQVYIEMKTISLLTTHNHVLPLKLVFSWAKIQMLTTSCWTVTRLHQGLLESLSCIHCKYLNAWFECNDIVISVYSHYPLDLNAKSSDTKCVTLSIRWFRIRIERVMCDCIRKLRCHCIQIMHSDIYSVPTF